MVLLLRAVDGEETGDFEECWLLFLLEELLRQLDAFV